MLLLLPARRLPGVRVRLCVQFSVGFGVGGVLLGNVGGGGSLHKLLYPSVQ